MRRPRFGRSEPEKIDSENLTKYDSRYILPTDSTVTIDEQSEAAEPLEISPDDGTETAQKPLVFALRAYRNMYVYEYPDRLEYYRYADGKMYRVNSEKKK